MIRSGRSATESFKPEPGHLVSYWPRSGEPRRMDEDADPFEALSIGISQPEVLDYYQAHKLPLEELVALYRRGPLEASGIVLLLRLK